jgi:hypothetical protein
VLIGTRTIALAAAASPPAIGVIADVSIPVVPISVVAAVALFAIAAVVLALAIALAVSVVVVPRFAAAIASIVLRRRIVWRLLRLRGGGNSGIAAV